MKPFPQALIGSWVHAAPWDSDDYYLAEYSIALRAGRPVVSAVDLNDGEKLKITKVTWDGKWLRFSSLMPSTGRVGVNEFRLNKNGTLESRFTFTVIETMKAAPPNPAPKPNVRKKRGRSA